jgi:hypothetical protein
MRLYYNAFHPLEILQTLTIKTSVMNGRDRGVSMSSQPLDCHGPFTFVFKEGVRWARQFKEVKYGDWDKVDFLHKSRIFEGEFEWWSPEAVEFTLVDVERVYFRPECPGAKMRPRVAKKVAGELAKKYPFLLGV